MAITISNERHIQAINNLGVIEHKAGKVESASARFQLANDLVKSQQAYVYEASFNLGCIKEAAHDFTNAFSAFQESLTIWPENTRAQRRLAALSDQFSLS